MDSNNANENDNGDRETKKKVPKKLLKRGFVDFKVREPKKDKFGEDKYGKDIKSSKNSTNKSRLYRLLFIAHQLARDVNAELLIFGYFPNEDVGSCGCWPFGEMTKELIDKHDTKNFMKYWEKVYSEVEVKRGGKTSTSEEVDVIESEIEDENNLEHAVLDKDLSVQEFVVEVETEVETNFYHVLHKDLTQQEYVVEDVDVTYGDSILESWLSSFSDTTAPPAAISSATVTPTSPATSRVQNPPYQLANNTETLIVLNGPDPMIQSTIPKTVITEVLSPSVESSVATSSRPVNVIETVPLPSSDLVLAKPTLPDTVAVFTTVNLPTSSLIHQASHQAASVQAQLPVCSVSTNTLLSAAMNQSTMPVCSVSENTLLSATMGQSKSNPITSTEILLPPVSSSVSTSSRPVNVIETVPLPSSDLVLANPTLPDTVDAVTTVNLPTSSLIQQATHETASVEAQLLVCSVAPNTPISAAMNQSTMPVCSVSGNTPLSAAMIQSKTHQTVITEFLLPSVASSVTASSRSDPVKVLATVNLPLSSTIYVKSSLPPKRSIPLAISEDTRKSKRSRKEKSFSDDKQSHSDSSSRQKERCGAQDCRKPRGNALWVKCDGCNERFHQRCLGIKRGDVDVSKDYLCPKCMIP